MTFGNNMRILIEREMIRKLPRLVQGMLLSEVSTWRNDMARFIDLRAEWRDGDENIVEVVEVPESELESSSDWMKLIHGKLDDMTVKVMREHPGTIVVTCIDNSHAEDRFSVDVEYIADYASDPLGLFVFDKTGKREFWARKMFVEKMPDAEEAKVKVEDPKADLNPTSVDNRRDEIPF